ncbi:G kinase-anchoring protein 1-like isoform X2 [Diorhabda carinulata]|uniref:G kinase-anchoring protein 1-like isoform X2 n=1 Tax=Diorhabda carinulata TaxID=1163345 RepID=UPI0025A06BC1|nr:G kinase-anchoring protein 1-like isoform X2 [Diorhabda carinulata]
MDNIVPSRFSCLKIEDDDFIPAQSKPNKKKVVNKKSAPVNTNKLSSKQQPSNSSSKKSKAKVKNEGKQWEEWKKKDTEYIDENFEQDLQSAILQSKLDYENRKKNEPPDTQGNDKNSKKKKPKTMTLDQFLDGDKPVAKKEKVNQLTKNDQDFFESVLHSAKEEARKEKVEAKRKERSNNIEEIISLAQCQEKLQKEIDKNEVLKKDLEQARKDITIVKERNKMLYNMLSQGEMKDKATVLLELEKLTTVKEELTEEVGRLHKLLEQERSKANLTISNLSGSASESHAKQKKKKKT